MSKPSEFYIGVLDFFAILLPGAIATAVLAPSFGHLILGSYIDQIYNVLRERLSPYGNESAYQCATRIRNSMIDDMERNALNTFQWARSVLIAKCPAAAEDVHRLEADSKFFRSLLVVATLCASVFLYDGKILAAVLALGLVVPCFARYYERRLKSTTQAYIHIVTLHRLGQLLGAAGADAG